MGEIKGNPCTYYKVVGCKSCNYISYKKCKNFIKAHNTTLISAILPVSDIEKGVEIKYNKPIFARESTEILRALAKFSITHNKKIYKYNLNQSITLGIDYPETLVGKLVFLEFSGKAVDDKILGVVYSFIDKLEMNKCQVFILSKVPNITIQSNFKKL